MPDADMARLYDDKGTREFLTLSVYQVHKGVDERLTGIAWQSHNFRRPGSAAL